MNGISFSGFNGFDFGKIVDVIIQSESRPLADLQKQERAIRDKDSALSSLGIQISRIETPVESLTSETLFTNVGATSSDATVATVSLGSGGIAGKYDLSITQLAKAQVTSSTNGYTNTTDAAADGGSISFTIGGTTTTAITITAQTTLAGLKDQINNQNSGVVASIVNDGTNNKLVISGRSTGSTNGFTINNSLTNSGGTVVAFAAGQSTTTGNAQNSQNALLTVNGLSITSASNTVTDAVPGVSATLIKAGSVSVDVAADYGALKETVKTLVTEYNKLRDFYKRQSGIDGLGQAGPLGNDSVMRQAVNDIRNTILTSNANGGRYHYLSEVGLEFSQTGELKFDETKFNTALNSYSTDLKKLFQGVTGVNGVFDDLKSKLDNLDATAGLVKTTRNSLDATIKGYRDRIAAQQMRLEIRRQELTKMYAAADQAMSKLNAASGPLAQLGSRSLF